MAKVSKNSKVGAGKIKGGGKNHVKIVVSERDPKTGAYVYKEKMVHKDQLEESLKGF